MRSRALIGLLLVLFVAVCARAEIKPAVKPYHVDSTLSDVANFAEFKDAMDHYNRAPFVLSSAQRQAMARNGFVVAPGEGEQFFQIYESEHYGMRPRIPNFLTADCVLQMYHLLYDFTLKSIEVQSLYPALKDLTEGMLDGSVAQYKQYSDSLLKAAAQRNMVLFAVPARLLGVDTKEVPAECGAAVDSELARIERHDKRDTCHATLNGMDYTQFAVRGHYTRSAEMQAYFKAMMWYGTGGLPLDSNAVENSGSVFQTLMITDLLFADSDEPTALIKLWDKIYSITALYVGSSNNLEPHQVWNAVRKSAYSNESLAEEFRRPNEFRQLWEWNFHSLPGPELVQQAIGLPTGRQFRFMSQRFMPDSYVLQKLSHFNYRPFPKGMDVMAVLGSARAAEILDQKPEEWPEYLPRRDSLKTVFAAYDAEWEASLAAGWLHALQALNDDRGEGYPSFMHNAAWNDKELATSLASWSQMRRDVILYAEPSYAEGGDGADEIMQPKGYIEPVSDFYARLLKLVQQNRRILMAAGYLADDAAAVFEQYEDILTFFKRISDKELTNQPLTTAEYERIRTFGLTIENLSLDILKLDRAMPIHDERTGDAGGRPDVRDIHLESWFQVTGPDRDVACIADVHTSLGRCLEEAVGHIDEIYVVVPIEGELHITRGGVFSYYEFTYPAEHRLNDEAWQEMIKRGRAPERPAWVSSFVVQ